MYSDENNLYNYQYDDSDNYSYNENNSKKGIVIKIIIIILCIILLIWLFGLLKESKNNNESLVYDVNKHNANITNVRLSAEKYFFINNNLPQGNNVKTISLQTLINEKLSGNIVDANNKVCDNTKSVISLNKENTSYVMRINLMCSTNEKEEIFYYDYSNYKCLNCSDKTYMTGNDQNINTDTDTNSDDIFYSCTEWSDWTTTRVNNDLLTERTRTMVRAIKKGQKEEVITYGNWSDFTTTPVTPSDTIDVETKEEFHSSYGRVMTTKENIKESSNIKIISEEKENDKIIKECPSGYSLRGNKCYGSIRIGDLDYKKYATYDIINKGSVEVKTEKSSDGKYSLVYKNCKYRDVVPAQETVIKGETTYTYQKKKSSKVIYYRYRTITKELKGEDDIITNDYYEENNLPLGYEKYPGSEKVEYSYKMTSCVK